MDQMDHGILQNQSSIEKRNSTESLSGRDELAYRFKVSGITDRQNTSGLRTKKYTIEDTKRFNDLNARYVILIGKQYKAKYARILIRERKDYEKD